MRHLPLAVVAALLCCAATLRPVRAATPLGTGFTYQGQLKQSGTPVNGTADFQFSLWDAATGPNQVGNTQTMNGVSVTGGLFTVTLNPGSEFGATAFNGDKRWLEISVNATTLSPRQELTAAPYALRAPGGGLTLPYSGSADVASPNAAFKVTTTGTGYGLWGQSDGAGGIGVMGSSTATSGFAYGGNFTSNSTDGRGCLGFATAATGSTYGGRFVSSSTSGVGVYGLVTASNGTTYGGRFESSSTFGYGVYGLSSAVTGFTHGMKGETNSTDGTGVFGLANATSGANYGGWMQSDSAAGRGCLGFATATTGSTIGVYGRADSTSGVGVYGKALSTTGANYGVYGESFSASGYGVWAQGRSGASGTKSFRIDHPDDPENKYLLHYATESPEAINFYRGTVILDEAGEAVVKLPKYFAKINKDPSYQLTAVGAPMPMLHVAQEIDEAALSAGARAELYEAAPVCSFRIAGGAPRAKVSWRVEALRNDKWVQQRGAPVEVDKKGLEKGTYQHPELYGQPKERGTNYRADDTRPMAEPAAGGSHPTLLKTAGR